MIKTRQGYYVRKKERLRLRTEKTDNTDYENVWEE